MVYRSNDQRPSLLTIARALGISTSTVSNVYNKPDRVGAATRARVLAEAARIGYLGPDPSARQLRRGSTDLVGLIFTDELSFAFRDQAATGFMSGLAWACGRAGKNLVLLSAGAPSQSEPRQQVALAPMDGAVVYSVADHDPAFEQVVARGLPLVVVDQPGPDARWTWVGLDEYASAKRVGEHLREFSHVDVAVITSRLSREPRNGLAASSTDIAYRVRRERLRGFSSVFPAEGAPSIAVHERFESSERSGAEAFDAIWDAARRPTAIFCLSDALALGALARARERGVAVPQDVSIIGFDDVPAAASVGLSTMNQPLEEKGREAGAAICALIDEPRGGRSRGTRAITLQTTLQVRSTVGPALV
ncbi:LacI family DNA-binding transcriptional regulator [Microbacterium sp.]|uniref:LacI family DNA-binding transcriptional regulator n=1 Tax=Microbacterium sp. TaxID=51671 RepID=UPI0035B01176